MIETHLADGTPVLVRAIQPDDKPLLVAGMSRLSDRSRHLRFLTATDRLSRSQLAYLTEIDGHSHQAWGALIADEPVGIGRFVRGPDNDAEVALTVVDEWQRRGIGLLLLTVLADEAHKVGVKRFTFVALPENTGISRLLARFGAVGKFEDGLLTADLDVAAVTSAEINN